VETLIKVSAFAETLINVSAFAESLINVSAFGQKFPHSVKSFRIPLKVSAFLFVKNILSLFGESLLFVWR
jgi:hypothetical protein